MRRPEIQLQSTRRVSPGRRRASGHVSTRPSAMYEKSHHHAPEIHHTGYQVPNHQNLAIQTKYTDNVVFAFNQLMMALLGRDIQHGGGGGGRRGGGGRGGDGHGFYKKIIDALLLRRCIKCTQACLSTMRIPLNHGLVVKYTQVLVNSIDSAFMHHHGITLSSYIQKTIGRVQLPPVLQQLLPEDATHGVRMRVVRYLLVDAVGYWLPGWIPELEMDAMYQSLQPEIIKYISKGKGDLSMLAGALVSYILTRYEISGIDMRSAPCMMCHSFNRRCQ